MGPAIALAVPGASSRFLPALGDWMTANDRWIQVVIGVGFGIWLLVKASTGRDNGAALSASRKPGTADTPGVSVVGRALHYAGDVVARGDVELAEDGSKVGLDRLDA